MVAVTAVAPTDGAADVALRAERDGHGALDVLDDEEIILLEDRAQMDLIAARST